MRNRQFMTDEQNKQNQAGNSNQSGASGQPGAAAPVSSPKVPSAGPVSAVPPKKRRRRRKKKTGAVPGQDVPLVLPSKQAGLEGVKAPRDVSAKELTDTTTVEPLKDIKVPRVTVEPAPVEPELPLAPVAPIAPVMETPTEMVEAQMPSAVPITKPKSVPQPVTQPLPQVPPEVPPVPEPSPPVPEPLPPVPEPSPPAPEPSFSADLDQSQKIFEEGVVQEPDRTEETKEASAKEEPATEEPDTSNESRTVVAEVVTPAEHQQTLEEENAKRQASLDEAKKLSESLIQEDTVVLEELPPKQGILGRLFNVLERLVHGRDVEKFQKNESSLAKPKMQEQPQVTMAEATGNTGPGLISRFFKFLIKLAILAALVAGAFWLGSSLRLMDYVNSWFKAAPSGLELVKGDNAKVVQDQEMVEKWGFQTAVYFGRNGGDLRDVAYNVFFNAAYFGKLRDPVFYGETGITAAIYYGFGKESDYVKNRFIYYVNYLAKIRYANQVRIQDVLRGKTDRDQALETFLKDANVIFTEGNKLRKEINTQVDDLKISVNSINPDKDRYETDFFASLDETEAEKAQTLLGKFVEVTQKQTELKAKLAALSKLAGYYEADLITMKIRLDAIEKNKQALISGVTVVETPGVDLNLVK